MTEIAFAVLAVGMFFIGYFLRNIHDRLQEVIENLKPQETLHTNESKESRSFLVESLTPEQEAKKDFEERMKRINS